MTKVPTALWSSRFEGEPDAEVFAYGKSLASAVAAFDDPLSTPSARVLRAMARDHGNSHASFVLAQSLRHRNTVGALPFPSDLAEDFARLAEESLVRQREIESADTVPFEVYRQQYLDPGRLSVSADAAPRIRSG